MTRVIDENGRLAMPEHFRPGEAVEVKIEGANVLVVRKASSKTGEGISLRKLTDGSTVIMGLPTMDSEDVKRMLEEFP